MVRLEHVNLVVKNIDSTKRLLLAAFPSWRVRGEGDSEWFGQQRHWVHIGDDDYYITLNDSAEGENRDLSGHMPGLAHIGFVVSNLDEVCKRLNNANFHVTIYGPEHPYRKTLYFLDDEGFEFEFIEYPSHKPDLKNMYGGETNLLRRI